VNSNKRKCQRQATDGEREGERARKNNTNMKSGRWWRGGSAYARKKKEEA